MISRKFLFCQSTSQYGKSIKFMSNDSFWGKVKGSIGLSKKSEEKDIFAEVPGEEITKMEEEFMSIQTDQEKEDKIARNRLKSKLFYSDRALLHNQQPQAGIGNLKLYFINWMENLKVTQILKIFA